MQISVSGKHLDVGAALQAYAEEELSAVISKYFENAISADVVFSKVRHLFRADVLVNEGTGTNARIRASAEEDDSYAAFDLAVARIGTQLRRYKSRIQDHHKIRPDKEGEVFAATKYVLSPSSLEQVENISSEEGGAPLIIAEKATEIETLTVSDAVMRMDLGSLPAVMFINKKSGAVNVVYRREDGNISWIDSSVGAAKTKAA